MKQNRNYKRYGLTTVLARYGWTLIIILFVLGLAGEHASHALQVGLGVAFWLIIFATIICGPIFYQRYINKKSLGGKRAEAVSAYANSANLSYSQQGFSLPNSSLKRMGEVYTDGVLIKNKNFTNHIVGDGWDFVDYSYQVYSLKSNSSSKNRLVEQYYTSAISTVLPNSLPNVFFDSKKNRLNFRRVFSGHQKYSFEGNFNEYFTSYMPTDYEIDALSFVTPNVMIAMQAASDYDIEIKNGRLYLYSSQYDASKQIPDMSQKILEIHRALAHNASTYKDNSPKPKVVAAGTVPTTLQGSNVSTYKTISILVVVIIGLVAGITQRFMPTAWKVFAGILAAILLYTIVSIVSKIHSADSQ